MLFTNSLLWLVATTLVAASGTATVEKRAALNDCLNSAKVPQATPGTANFTQGIMPFNQRLPFTPVALAQPTVVSQVQAAVSCAASLGVTVSPKSGGHSYASHGLGGEDGHLCIDMRWFNNVTVNSTTGVASVGPGGRLGNIAQALYNQSKAAISHGTCPGVGAGGLSLHGGYGFSSFTHGLTLDNLIGAQVVLANSTVVNASATQNPDLFWALRGAGSSFGVVTNLQFQTYPAPDSNVVFNFPFNWNQSAATAAVAAIQDYSINTQPKEMNMRVLLNGYSTTLLGVYYGSLDNYKAAIKPLTDALNTTSTGNPQVKGWIDTLSTYSYGSLTTPFNYDDQEDFVSGIPQLATFSNRFQFSKSLMSPKLDSAAIAALVNYWYTVAKQNSRAWYLILDNHGGKNSAVSQVAGNATAYAHRGAIFKMEFYDRSLFGSYPSDGFSFLNGWVNAITTAQNSTIGMYYNYADTTLNSTTAHQEYWLDNYSRLSSLKTIWDPKQVFSNPQAVNSK